MTFTLLLAIKQWIPKRKKSLSVGFIPRYWLQTAIFCCVKHSFKCHSGMESVCIYIHRRLNQSIWNGYFIEHCLKSHRWMWTENCYCNYNYHNIGVLCKVKIENVYVEKIAIKLSLYCYASVHSMTCSSCHVEHMFGKRKTIAGFLLSIYWISSRCTCSCRSILSFL